MTRTRESTVLDAIDSSLEEIEDLHKSVKRMRDAYLEGISSKASQSKRRKPNECDNSSRIETTMGEVAIQVENLMSLLSILCLKVSNNHIGQIDDAIMKKNVVKHDLRIQ